MQICDKLIKIISHKSNASQNYNGRWHHMPRNKHEGQHGEGAALVPSWGTIWVLTSMKTAQVLAVHETRNLELLYKSWNQEPVEILQHISSHTIARGGNWAWADSSLATYGICMGWNIIQPGKQISLGICYSRDPQKHYFAFIATLCEYGAEINEVKETRYEMSQII